MLIRHFACVEPQRAAARARVGAGGGGCAFRRYFSALAARYGYKTACLAPPPRHLYAARYGVMISSGRMERRCGRGQDGAAYTR